MWQTLEGRVVEGGEIEASIDVDVLWGKENVGHVSFNGNLNELVASGSLDDFYDVVLSFELDQYKSLPTNTSFDGTYFVTLYRHHPDEGIQQTGSAQIIIEKGLVKILLESAELETGSVDLWQTLEGKVGEDGEITITMDIDLLWVKEGVNSVKLAGDMDGLEIKGTYDDYFNILMSLKLMDE